MSLEFFEAFTRRASQLTQEPVAEARQNHPFEQRAIYDKFPAKVRSLFDDAHYAEATFEAFKFLDRTVAKMSGNKESGQKLMMQAFSENGGIKLNGLSSQSEKDEQEGYRFIFAGAIAAVRNPRGHEHSHFDTIDKCLDHLSFASMLIRRLDDVQPASVA